jgi:hypothetical protein
MKIINFIILFILIALFLGCKIELHPLNTLKTIKEVKK